MSDTPNPDPQPTPDAPDSPPEGGDVEINVNQPGSGDSGDDG